MASNFRPLAGEKFAFVDPLYEMRVYDSLPIEVRQAIAFARVKLRPSIIANALQKFEIARIIEIIREIDQKSQAEYEAACLVELEVLKNPPVRPSAHSASSPVILRVGGREQ